MSKPLIESPISSVMADIIELIEYTQEVKEDKDTWHDEKDK